MKLLYKLSFTVSPPAVFHVVILELFTL